MSKATLFIAFLVGFTFQPPLARAQCPIVRQQQLLASDGGQSDILGSSMSLDGVWLALGSPRVNDVGRDSGAVYLFRFDGRQWVETQKLQASDGAASAGFGASLHVSGDRLLVGATGNEQAYVFRLDRQNGVWNEEQILFPAEGGRRGYGNSAAIEGDVALVGAFPSGRAHAYFYEIRDGIWSDPILIAPPVSEPGSFGGRIAIDGGTALIGAAGGNAAFVYRASIPTRTLTFVQRLTATDVNPGDAFGASLDIDGDHIVVGAPHDGDQGTRTGSVYYFRFNGTFWQQEQEIELDEPQIQQDFGAALDLEDGVLLVGAPRRDVGPGTGAAYVFRLDGTRFETEHEILDEAGRPDDLFGTTVALDGPVTIIGATGLDRQGIPDVGGALVFSDTLPALIGTVNRASGVPQDVLFVNDSAGGRDRVVEIRAGDPLTFRLDAPPMGPVSARYACFVWTGPPSRCRVLTQRGERLGFLVNPIPRQAGQPKPFRCLSSPEITVACSGVPMPAGAPRRAPWRRTRPQGVGMPGVLTIQAVLDDEGAANSVGWSVTNAVILDIR